MSGPSVWVTRVIAPASGAAAWVEIECDADVEPSADHRVHGIRSPFDEHSTEILGVSARLGDCRTLASVLPSKIICVGRNYRAHAQELGHEVPTEPLLFFKPPSCLVAHGAEVDLPRGYERIDMEAELVVVIGKRARKVEAIDAWDHVFGLTLGNDVSCRDLQKRDGQWTRAKGFDGFGPVGPFIYRTPPSGISTDRLRIRGLLDGRLVQDASVSDMIFPIPFLIEFVSACMTLEAGDIIFTGTPAGVSPVGPGSVTRIELEGLPLRGLETRFK